MTAPNFTLITELQTLVRRDFGLANEAILNPLNAQPIVDGEWLELDSSYLLARGSGQGTNPLVFPVHTERGRYDTQAIKKVNVLMLGMYEAETTMVDMTSLTVGDRLCVNDATISGIVRRALKEDSGAGAGRVIVGYVSKVVSTTKVRFIHMGVTQYVV